MDRYREAGRVVLLVLAGLITAGVSASPQATATAAATGSVDPSSCATDNTSLPCKLEGVLLRANVSQAGVHGVAGIDTLSIKTKQELHPGYIPVKEKKHLEALIKKDLAQTLPELGKAIAEAPSAEVRESIRRFKNQYAECMNGAVWLPGEADEAYEARVDSCDVKLQQTLRQANQSLGFSVGPASPNFRNSRWGDSMSAVIASEGQPVKREANDLIYAVKLSGVDAGAIFYFVDGHLARGTYLFNSKHSDFNLYLDDFEKVQAILISKYGKQSEGGQIWRNDALKGNRSNWGMAIAAGQMTMGSVWENGDTNITHTLTGDNLEITHGIVYDSVEYAPDLKKAALSHARSGY